MKKQLIFLALIILCTLTGCGSQASDTQTKNESKESDVILEDSVETQIGEEIQSLEEKTGVKVTDNRKKDSSGESGVNTIASQETAVTEDDFEIEEYMYETKFGDTYYYLIVTSNAPIPVAIGYNGIAKDNEGNAVGADSMSIDVIGPGETSIGYFYFNDVTGIASVDYQADIDTNIYYYPVITNLDMVQTLNDKNVTVTITNNGDVAAQFVEAYALFFDANHNIIKTDSNYVTDGDSEIKPGATISSQLDIYTGNYDHVEVYLTGRATGKSTIGSKEAASVSDKDFDIKEYKYETKYGGTYYFLIIQNNSTETVSISGNATALDEGGNSVGAGNASIDVLGPGETTISYFYFSDVKGIEEVKYNLSYSSSIYYSPVLADLNVEATLNNKNVVVSVTNNGNKPAQFVQAYALFFDVNGQITWMENNYITDNDSEIKPGATISKQMDCRNGYENVEVYLTGRAHN